MKYDILYLLTLTNGHSMVRPEIIYNINVISSYFQVYIVLIFWLKYP